MKNIIRTLGLAAILAWAGAASAADDVGLVNQLNGDVSYSSGGSSAKAKSFMKVREGDKFIVHAGSQLRIVYFQGGRQELYSGPATLVAGAQASQQQTG